MFLLFLNLYLAMFTGQWVNYNWNQIFPYLKEITNGLGTFVTSIFGDNQMTNLGDSLFTGTIWNGLILIVSFILALITSIGIVVMAVKGIKRVFSIFFMPIR